MHFPGLPQEGGASLRPTAGFLGQLPSLGTHYPAGSGAQGDRMWGWWAPLFWAQIPLAAGLPALSLSLPEPMEPQCPSPRLGHKLNKGRKLPSWPLSHAEVWIHPHLRRRNLATHLLISSGEHKNRATGTSRFPLPQCFVFPA